MSSIRSMRDYDERTQHLKHLWHETVIKRLLDNAEHLERRVGAFFHDMSVENFDVRHLYSRTLEFEQTLADIRRLLLETEIFQDKEIFFEGFLKESAEAERLAAATRRTRARKAVGRAAKSQELRAEKIARKRPRNSPPARATKIQTAARKSSGRGRASK